MIKSFILARKIKSRGDLLVGKVRNEDRNKTYYYSINEGSKTYSFWSWDLGKSLILEDSGLTYSQAQFKMVLLGG